MFTENVLKGQYRQRTFNYIFLKFRNIVNIYKKSAEV